MYIEYVQKPLHNLLLWITGMMPGNSLALGIIVFALLTKIVILVFVYHGHINNIIHHQIRKHSDSLAHKHKGRRHNFDEELSQIYEHYQFHPWKGLVVAIIQFAVFFMIINFLYAGSIQKFDNLGLSIMENVFMASSMSTSFLGASLFEPINNFMLILGLFVVQFVSLEIYLLTKRKFHRHQTREEIVEHIINICLSLTIVYAATVLPMALSLYWAFFLLYGILIKIIFDKYIDNKILEKIEKVEMKIQKAEEPKIKKLDETFIFLIWKIFHPKSTIHTFRGLKRKIKQHFIGIHHTCHLHHPHRKLYEEPFVWAMIFLLLIVLGFNIWK
jgi:membrane protein insertase Oxa1/YidC/SpoIIIJ